VSGHYARISTKPLAAAMLWGDSLRPKRGRRTIFADQVLSDLSTIPLRRARSTTEMPQSIRQQQAPAAASTLPRPGP